METASGINNSNVDNSYDSYDEALSLFELCLFVVGVLCNIVVCIVIVRSKSMHTVTNCYLFNLSISDLLLLVFRTLPDIDGIFPQNVSYEDDSVLFVVSWVSETSRLVSVLTVATFTVERYLAVCRPLYIYTTSKVRRTIKRLILFWVLSLMCAFPRYILPAVKKIIVNWTYRDYLISIHDYLDDVSAVVFYAIPMIGITVLYILIGIRIFKRNEVFEGDSSINSDSSQKVNFIVMGIIVVSNFIAWSPVFVMVLIQKHADENFIVTYFSNFAKFFLIVRMSRIILLLSPVVNPVIYNLTSMRFRNAFKEVIWERRRSCCLCGIA